MASASPGSDRPSVPCASRVAGNKLLPKMAHGTVCSLGSVGTVRRCHSWGAVTAFVLKISVRTVTLSMGNRGNGIDPLVLGFNWCDQWIRNTPLYCNVQAEARRPQLKGAFVFGLCSLCSQGPPPGNCGQQFLPFSSSRLQLRGHKKVGVVH